MAIVQAKTSNTYDVLANGSAEKKYYIPYYPIGAIIEFSNDTDPNEVYYYGTWARFGNGQVLIGVDENDENFDTANKIGGEKAHTLTIDEMPKHNHTIGFDQMWSFGGTTSIATTKGGPYPGNSQNYIKDNGGGKSHNNLPPYVVVYRWERTA